MYEHAEQDKGVFASKHLPRKKSPHLKSTPVFHYQKRLYSICVEPLYEPLSNNNKHNAYRAVANSFPQCVLWLLCNACFLLYTLTFTYEGVDPDLYELTNIKLETSANSSQLEDALNQLMSSAVKSGTSSRKPPQDDELSAEAGRVIDALPDLSFMKARFLMFPSLLVSRECSAE
uniref:Uncharacterized protein n=1 Tax=Anabas testudineus TaxID=64144 RepID=A0A3Q1IHI1_ANATE